MRFDPMDPAFVADPYPVYAALRAAGPQWCASAGVWMIARRAQVDALLRDRRLGRVVPPREPADAFTAWNMINQLNMPELEPPGHPRQRRLVARAFTARRLENLRPQIRRQSDDLLSALVEASDGSERLSVDEVVAVSILLLNAGHEAAVNVLAGAVRIPKGQRVGLLLGAANRDRDVFDRPDDLDVSRNSNPHVGFGAGIHYCLGAPLARLEVAEALGAMLRRGRHWELAEDPELRTTSQFRGPSRLVLELS